MKHLKWLVCVLLLITACASAETQVITVTCGGDTMLGCNEKVRPNDYSFDNYIDQYGYAYPLSQLQSLFANDDVTLVNLEVVLYEDTKAKYSTSRLVFRGAPEYTEILKQGSVEVVNLANNHTDDYERAGYDSTIKALDEAGIGYCGSTSYGNYVYVYEKDGIKVGFVGVIPMYYKDNQKKVEDCFKQLRDAGCQVIIASLHCGTEYSPLHGDMHDRYRKLMAAQGANIVIGTHPHVPQGIIVSNGVTQIYSLGNLTFGGNTGVDEVMSCIQGTVAQFALHFEDGVYVGHQLTLYPIHQSGTSPNNNYQPVLVGGDDALKVMRMIQKDTTTMKLNPYVEGEGAVQDFVPWPSKK